MGQTAAATAGLATVRESLGGDAGIALMEEEEGSLIPKIVEECVGGVGGVSASAASPLSSFPGLEASFRLGAWDVSSPASILSAAQCVRDFLLYSPSRKTKDALLSSALKALSEDPLNGVGEVLEEEEEEEEEEEGKELGMGAEGVAKRVGDDGVVPITGEAGMLAFILLRIARVWALWKSWGGELLCEDDLCSLSRPTLSGVAGHVYFLRKKSRGAFFSGKTLDAILAVAEDSVPDGPTKLNLLQSTGIRSTSGGGKK